VTDAGGRLTGINGWGIIIKGSSNPGGGKKKREVDLCILLKHCLFYLLIDKQYSSDGCDKMVHTAGQSSYVSVLFWDMHG